MTLITNRQTIGTIPPPPDAQLVGMVRLASAIYCRAQLDIHPESKDALAHRLSALCFVSNNTLAQSIAEILECENDGMMEAPYQITRKYFIELNDPSEGGRRSLTDAQPVIIYGYVQPLRRARRGISSVIIVEEPADFAATWRALPTDEWIALDGYKGPAGYITEREYARLLSHLEGLLPQHVSLARRRALDSESLTGASNDASRRE